MRRALLALILFACGGPSSTGAPDAQPDADTRDLLARLRALPGVTADELVPNRAPAGYRYFALTIDQPVDHDAPSGAHFTQHLTLIANDQTLDAPLVLFSTGYWNYQGDYPSELALLLHGNQLVIEHRFFGDSRPTNPDWTKLTIQQAAADQHAIVQTFTPIFGGKWITTGASKGGMTSIYHRRFYPDDVAGTVAYVAPISFGAPDNDYDTWVNDTIGTQPCRDQLKALAAELLKNRRTELVQRATTEMNQNPSSVQYTRVAIGPAVEGAVTSLYWSFWQYYGKDYCAYLPQTTDSTDLLWTMLEGTPNGSGVWGYGVSPVYSSDDANLARFEAYDFQASWQLGYPGTIDTYLSGLKMYTDADYSGANPIGVAVPAYDGGAAMNDVADWVKTSSSHMIWVYGGWDPWTGGKFDPGGAQDALEAIVPEQTHGAQMHELGAADRDAAYAKLAAWTGVTPDPTAVASAFTLRHLAPRERVPPLRHP